VSSTKSPGHFPITQVLQDRWTRERLLEYPVLVAAWRIKEVADGPWSRFKGLQFRKYLPPGCGLLLVPCPSVHTFFLRFPIDVLLLDRAGQVLAVRRAVRPWRLVLPVRHS